MRRLSALAVPFILLAGLLMAPGSAHAVVNGTFTVTGGNQQQVGQTTIKLTDTKTGQTIPVTTTDNGNKKTFGFILPDGSYTLTGTAGGQIFTQTFTTGGNGTASGGFNVDGGAFEQMHGGGVVAGGSPATVNGGGAMTGGAGTGTGTAPGVRPLANGRRFDTATQSVIEIGGGFGPLFNFENARVAYTGSFVGSGGTFNSSSVDVMPDFQFWANLRPAGWNGFFLGAAADVAIPTEGPQKSNFDTTSGLHGMSMFEPRDAMLTLQLRAGMRDPVLPGSLFIEGGIRLQDYRATVNAYFGPTLFEQFATDRLVALPTVGVGARIPLDKLFNAPALRRVNFDTEFNYTPGSNGFSMPGSNSLSGAYFQLRDSFSLLAKLEYEFDCFDP